MSNPNPIYFDHVSSTPVHPEVLKTLQEFYPIHYANAEALHDGGKVIGTMVEASRDQVAKLLKVKPEWVTFTSGATEANNAIIKGIANFINSEGCMLPIPGRLIQRLAPMRVSPTTKTNTIKITAKMKK